MMPPRSLGILLLLQCAILVTGCASGEKRRTLSNSERAAMLAEVAAGAINEGDPTGALATLLEAETYDPKNAYIQHLKGLAYFYKSDPDSALTYSMRAVELDPNYTDANNTVGKLLLDKGDYANARKYLEKAVKDPLYRDSFKPRTNLGILHYKLGEYAQAEIQLNRAILENPLAACLAYYYRGEIYLSRSRFTSALEDFSKATKKLCGGFEDAHLAIGITYARSKQYDKARRKFAEIQTLFPESPVAKKALDELRYIP